MGILEKIDGILAEKHLKRADLARMTGLSQSRISRWYGGEGVPTVHQGLAIARALGVPIEWLADDSMGEIPPDSAGLSEGERTLLTIARDMGGAPEMIRRWFTLIEPPRVLDDNGGGRERPVPPGRRSAR